MTNKRVPERSTEGTESAESTERAESYEAALLVRHREGDPDAFGELVQSYRRVVYSHLSRSAVPLEDRDDLFQDVFMKLHRSAATYDASRSLQPWLFTVVANTVRNYFRRQRVRQLVSVGEPKDERELEQIPDGKPSSSEEAVSREGARHLKAAIAVLSLPLRQVLLLVTIEGLTMRETATCLDIPLNTVKTRLRRARLSLLESQRRAQEGSGGRGLNGQKPAPSSPRSTASSRKPALEEKPPEGLE